MSLIIKIKHSGVREPNLYKAEATVTVFQVEFFRVEVTESPAQGCRRQGLMLGLHLRHLADSLQRAGTCKGAAGLIAAPPVPVFIHFVFWVDTVAGHWHRLSWQIGLLVMSGSSHSKLKKQDKEREIIFTRWYVHIGGKRIQMHWFWPLIQTC